MPPRVLPTLVDLSPAVSSSDSSLSSASLCDPPARSSNVVLFFLPHTIRRGSAEESRLRCRFLPAPRNAHMRVSVTARAPPPHTPSRAHHRPAHPAAWASAPPPPLPLRPAPGPLPGLCCRCHTPPPSHPRQPCSVIVSPNALRHAPPLAQAPPARANTALACPCACDGHTRCAAYAAALSSCVKLLTCQAPSLPPRWKSAVATSASSQRLP